MKKFNIWKKVALLVAVLLIFNIAVYFYILLSGPFDAAATAYRKQFASSKPEKIGLCITCRKGISFGGGGRRFKFTITVTENGKGSDVAVIYTFVPEGRTSSVVFEKRG